VLKNHSTFSIALFIVGSTSGLLSTGASAQYNYYDSGSFSNNINTYPPIDGKKWKSPSSSSSKKVNQPTTKRATNRTSANNSLPYTRDLKLSSKIREEYLDDIKERFPAIVDSFRDMLEKNDVVQATAKFIRNEGLDSGAMEGMMAYWFGQAWAVSNQKSFPTAQQYQGIADQIRTSMTKSSKLNKMSNVERQTFFEELSYRLFEQRVVYKKAMASGNTDSMNKIASESQKGLTRLGLNFKGKRLSGDGFQ
jgi:hypothetical protein